MVGNTVTSRDHLDKTIREIEDQEAEEAALTSDIKVFRCKKENGQLLFAGCAGKLAALAASGRRIINDMNKISRAA